MDTDLLCESCRRRRASVRITRFRGGPGRSVPLMRCAQALCLDCARTVEKLAMVGSSGGLLASDLCHYLVQELAAEAGFDVRTGCSGCGTPLAEVVSGGRVGCPMCYSRFAAEIEQAALQLHGATVHRGKAPAPRG